MLKTSLLTGCLFVHQLTAEFPRFFFFFFMTRKSKKKSAIILAAINLNSQRSAFALLQPATASVASPVSH